MSLAPHGSRSPRQPDPRDPESARPRRIAAGGRCVHLTLWMFGALLALFGFLSSIKATTERLTLSWLLRKKARRLRNQMAAAALTSGVSPTGAVAQLL